MTPAPIARPSDHLFAQRNVVLDDTVQVRDRLALPTAPSARFRDRVEQPVAGSSGESRCRRAHVKPMKSGRRCGFVFWSTIILRRSSGLPTRKFARLPSAS